MASYLGRRKFLATLGGAAAAWPLAARAQRGATKRIGVLMAGPEAQARLTAFVQGLQQLGWTVGQNIQVDYRWGSGNADAMRKYAAELIALAPHVMMVDGSPAVVAVQAAGSKVPIVFGAVIDPVGGGFVESLARPGGDVTGFLMYEYGISGKWLELLKEIAPRVTRAAVLRDVAIAAGSGQLGAIQSVAPQLGVELHPVGVRDANEIERGIAAFARGSNGGLIVTGSGLAVIHRDLIVTLAARHKLPAVYYRRLYVTDGGLISYGPDFTDQFWRAASYVDRILKGEKPADLPVQAPAPPDRVHRPRTRRRRRTDELRGRSARDLATHGDFRGQDLERRQAGRSADRVSDEIGTGDQFDGREGGRPDRAVHAARPRRRGDRMM
jgi:putative ABC transport system substrate-binding protein